MQDRQGSVEHVDPDQDDSQIPQPRPAADDRTWAEREADGEAAAHADPQDHFLGTGHSSDDAHDAYPDVAVGTASVPDTRDTDHDTDLSTGGESSDESLPDESLPDESLADERPDGGQVSDKPLFDRDPAGDVATEHVADDGTLADDSASSYGYDDHAVSTAGPGAVDAAAVDADAVDADAVDSHAVDADVVDGNPVAENLADEHVADEHVAGEHVAGEHVAGEYATDGRVADEDAVGRDSAVDDEADVGVLDHNAEHDMLGDDAPDAALIEDDSAATAAVAPASTTTDETADDPADDVPAVPVDGSDEVRDLLPGAAEPVPVGALWAEGKADGIRERWRALQLRFIDDPHSVAGEAEQLVGEAVSMVTASLNAQRERLGAWQGGGGDDTERLRSAVRQYRDFLDRLLGL